MNEDTKKALERLERELLEQETAVLPSDLFPEETGEEPTDPMITQETTVLPDDELLEDILSFFADEENPAFEDTSTIHDPEEPMTYRNFSNGYGTEEEEPPVDEEAEKKKRDDKINMGLMITASALCLGIILVLIYWMVNYL